MYLDSTMLLLIPALILALWAQAKVRSTYARYSKVPVRSGLSGADVARLILRDEGVQVSAIEVTPGELTDHYDPRNRALRLSEDVYYGTNIAALGIAAHEVGHAIQHAREYSPLALRNVVYPICNLGSSLGVPLFFLGLILSTPIFLKLGILFFTLAVFFTLITLPVEFNASRRALAVLANGRYLETDELKGARRVLSAAAMTYVAAALMALLQLLRMLILARSRD